MKIKKFNESANKPKEIFCVIVSDVGGFIEEENSVAFNNMLDATDYFIKYVNNSTDCDFEPMKDENGNRFFISAYDNPDWEKCLEYVDKYEINIEIIRIPLI